MNEITDDIFKALMAELKLELDLLLIRDPRKLFKEEECKYNIGVNEYCVEPP